MSANWQRPSSTGRWDRASAQGWYISDDNKFNAQLRPAGTYPYGKCTRHYAVFLVGTDTMIGTAKTLRYAEKYL